jgi:Uma2 family endonuclease
MTLPVDTAPKKFEPGTMGWTAADLDDPAIEREWFRGRYEIVEGVLTKIPPAYFTGGEALFKLMVVVDQHCKQHGPRGSFATEVDTIIAQPEVAVADAVFLTVEERNRQEEASRRAGKVDTRRTRLVVPPTLIIESISPGHEVHDQRTKRRWYADFGVKHYWILDAYRQSLECLTLHGNEYRTDARGSGKEKLSPSAFPGLHIDLASIWG